ncbi:hypothetical protein MMC24_002476 [Lignoscripta atroalba]|nr:hypothetical protein [Lignoscripta atroalba]
MTEGDNSPVELPSRKKMKLDEAVMEEASFLSGSIDDEHHDSAEDMESDEADEVEVGDEDEYDEDGYDEFEEFTWLKSVNATRIDSPTDGTNPEQIGHCHAKLLYRDRIRPNFYRDMEEPSQGTSALAFDLFDRWGSLRADLQEHPIKKGSGVWGSETDEGSILLFELVLVKEDHRKKGIGKSLVEEIWEKAKEMDPDCGFAFAWATHLNVGEARRDARDLSSADRLNLHRQNTAKAVAFWRALGFRRVGSSEWFCLAKDPLHPSRTLAAIDDYDPPDGPNMEGQSLADVSPIHSAIAELHDVAVVTFLDQYHASHAFTDASWRVLDEDGNTILHLAARYSKLNALRWLLGKSISAEFLAARNYAGETPLEALETLLETNRTRREVMMMTIPVSDDFMGHAKDSVDCLLELKCLRNPTADTILRTTYGCTCGECVGGFLSPRMMFTLQCHADLIHDMLNEEFCAFGVGEGSLAGAEHYSHLSYFFQHLDPYTRARLKTNKSLRHGATNTFKHIAQCVHRNLAPTTSNVRDVLLDSGAEKPPPAKHFLQSGGAVAPLVMQCFEFAMEEDIYLGNGDHELVFQDEIDKLKKCRNDREFVFARTQYLRLEGLPVGEEVFPTRL